MSIPGLNINSIDEIETCSDITGIKLMAFNCEPFMVPAQHVFGKCRLITEFEKISFIGEGAYGTVYKSRDKRNNKIVALKKIKIPQKNTGLPMNCTREINIVKGLEHQNVIKILGVAVGRDFESTYIILEYCPYELSKVIDDAQARAMINQSHVKCIIYQLFTGLDYIHQRMVLHRDLTMSNILFTENGFLKLADFGNCRITTKENLTPNVGTRGYKAPELIFGATKYSNAVDIWSAGCIFAELLLKRPLFKAGSDSSMISSMVDFLGTPSENQWPGFSKLPLMKDYDLRDQPNNRLTLRFAEQPATCITLLHKIFTYNPAKRITAKKCLINSYFTDYPTACDLPTLVALLKKADEI